MLCLSALSVQARADEAGKFDYYLLSYSWSPQYCASRPNDGQCGRGYGLVLHGLWPQYSKGYPESCGYEPISAGLVHEFAGLYPSESLAFHEWKKHGTCSGLSAANFLKLSQKLKAAVRAPAALTAMSQPLRTTADQLRKAFVIANPGLDERDIAFSCADGGRFLQEVYVCFDKAGEHPVACSQDVQRRSRKSCGQEEFLLRSVR